jgi:hypothetical protein
MQELGEANGRGLWLHGVMKRFVRLLCLLEGVLVDGMEKKAFGEERALRYVRDMCHILNRVYPNEEIDQVS